MKQEGTRDTFVVPTAPSHRHSPPVRYGARRPICTQSPLGYIAKALRSTKVPYPSSFRQFAERTRPRPGSSGPQWLVAPRGPSGSSNSPSINLRARAQKVARVKVRRHRKGLRAPLRTDSKPWALKGPASCPFEAAHDVVMDWLMKGTCNEEGQIAGRTSGLLTLRHHLPSVSIVWQEAKSGTSLMYFEGFSGC